MKRHIETYISDDVRIHFENLIPPRFRIRTDGQLEMSVADHQYEPVASIAIVPDPEVDIAIVTRSLKDPRPFESVAGVYIVKASSLPHTERDIARQAFMELSWALVADAHELSRIAVKWLPYIAEGIKQQHPELVARVQEQLRKEQEQNAA